ncbi:lymphocyte antigen 6E-like [Elgaria multicarinata webbii]|uniref:lymphocyte antigen 6E-like n=1 Tax=Elgaria multicarinata webbii TaxID=159646 RepID=UPI002FCCED8D
MKAFSAVLLVSALCMGRVSPLSCYRCQNAKNHEECTDYIKCSDMDKYCVTLTHQPVGQDFSISKWCAPDCPNFDTEIKRGKTNITTTCCITDYCNSGGPSSVKTSYAVVTMATLASFFYVFRTGL